jgi:hypothetical protein
MRTRRSFSRVAMRKWAPLAAFEMHAGDVVLHEAFEGHLDRFPASGATVNISLPAQNTF